MMHPSNETATRARRPRVLAVASSGGHWVQLMRMRPAWDDCDIAYLTTEAAYGEEVRAYALERGQPEPRFHTTVLATRWQKARLVRQLLEVFWVLLKERPGTVVSTGAAVGYFALRIGKLLGAKTLWIDSIANAEELSLSGQKICRHADICLTQWPHLATGANSDSKRQPQYWGSVI